MQEVAAHFGKDPREYSISTKSFERDEDGKLKGVNTVRVQWEKDAMGAWRMSEVPGSEEFFPADLVLLALGFLGPEDSAIKALGLEQDGRSNLKTPAGKYTTSVDGVFAAGDCRRGQSLIVCEFIACSSVSSLSFLLTTPEPGGINEGRSCAAEVDRFLVGESRLPNAGSIRVRTFKPPQPFKPVSQPVQIEAIAA